MHFIIVMQCTKTLALQDSKSHKINCVGMNSCNNCNPGKPFTQTVWEHRTPPGMGIIKIKSDMKKFSHMGWPVYRPRFQKTTEISVRFIHKIKLLKPAQMSHMLALNRRSLYEAFPS